MLQIIWPRVMRALRMEPGVFAEIGADQAATTQAIVVTIIAAAIGGIGNFFTAGRSFGGWILYAIIWAPVGLAIGAGILFLISRLFQAQGGYINLFRALGYAYSPNALAIVPILGSIVGGIYSLILAIRAVKETQLVSDGKAVAIVLIPAAVLFILFLILAVILSLALFGIFNELS